MRGGRFGNSPRRPFRPGDDGSAPAPLEGPPEAPRLIVGQNPVREALRAAARPVREVLTETPANPRVEALARFAVDHGALVRSVSRGELDRLTQGGRHQGVVAWASPLAFVEAHALLEDPHLLAIALDGVTDPQNFGAVVRSAVGVAGAAIVFPENAAAPLTPATFRASAGAVEHARLCRVRSLPSFLAEAQSQGARVVGLAPEGERRLDELDLSGPTVLVIGSEESGMNRSTRKACTDLVRLTSTQFVQSLNASVAAGIALYAASLARRPR